ncbi:MAG TPA: isoprenylcysteine carboxylmethyltransferase family protein [Acidimicrobiales bacterium]|nr:isoprenylcysteine carboxylmethyltransferase family protein [Acidimicrobiales bacterium]
MLSATAVPPVARTLLIATAVVWVVMELRQGTKQRSEGVVNDRRSRMVLRIAIFVGVIGSIEAARLVTSAAVGDPDVAAWVGLVFLWCGIALRFWSFQTLGRYFTFTVQTSADQPVITDGPYRVLRHPSYAGILLAVVGIGLFVGNYLSLACLTGAVACGLVYRIHVEEQALLRDLGERYRTYAATHKRLVPFVW